jgi:hypothetical protein
VSPPRFASLVLVAAVLAVGLPGCVFYLNPQCNDLIRNGDETDIDCGGKCATCDIGDRCNATSDCYESTCNGGACTALPCDNGIKDGQETDVDCGGGTCRPCAGGRHCEAASDCRPGVSCTAEKVCFSLPMVSFAEAVAYPSDFKAYYQLAGDLNGDGFIDLVTLNELESKISVFLNQGGTGTFQRVDPLFKTGEFPTGGALVDFNRDNIPDVVTANYHGNSVSVLLGVDNGMGKGTGALATALTFPTVAGGETSNLAIGDLNNDQLPDVVAANPGAHSVSVLLGQGGGMLGPATNVLVGNETSSEPFSTAIGDFNGDGNRDLAIAEDRSRTIIVRLGNGDGTFGEEVPYVDGGLPAYVLITSDVDLDGRLDLVCANRESDDVSVLLGRGDGLFRRTPIVASTGAKTGPYAIAVADFNRDGVPDLVTANYRTGTATVLLGIGNGKFEEPFDAGPVGDNSYGVATGDFNNDLRPDFAISNAVSNDVRVKLNTSR